MNRTGKVILVGAGPGDPGLLTVKGREYLSKADVVVYDRLIAGNAMDSVSPHAELIFVGKEQGRHPIPQHEINAILAREAKQGKLVVRLKGGDPFVFGRGAEELELLLQEGLPFEVVPGVTSPIAALAYAGIPATHRDHASSLHIITGHAKENGRLDIDYDALIRTKGTLIFLMSVSTMNIIVDGLLKAGMPADTPAAMVENGTLPIQRRLQASLGDVVGRAKDMGIKSPAILAVGGVCGSDGLDWFGGLPLKGKSVVVTRPANRAGTLSAKLEGLGANAILFPCIHTEHMDSEPARKALAELSGYEWLALTSPQGVDSLFTLLDGMGLDSRALAGVKIAAIGPSTAAGLASHGIKADYIPLAYDAANLATGLTGLARGKVLLLRAQVGTPELPETLSANGIEYDDIATYRTIHRCDNSGMVLEQLEKGGIDYITFTSRSTVEAFNECIPGAAEHEFTAVCIGPSTLAAAEKLGYKTITAQMATIDSMVDRIMEDVGVWS